MKIKKNSEDELFNVGKWKKNVGNVARYQTKN